MASTRQATIKKLEKATFDEPDSTELPPADIIAYNELRSCADLFRMHTEGILEIQPVYERDIVWTHGDQTRFIDSLIKQLPIPSMCFSLDYKTEKFQVIDGLQRMSTIIRAELWHGAKFLNGTNLSLICYKERGVVIMQVAQTSKISVK